MAVIVLRIDNPKALPEGIFSNEEEITFLKDGAFFVDGGAFAKDARQRALDAVADAFFFGHNPLAFHQDPRGVFWAKLATFMNKPKKEIQVPGFGRFIALDISYEAVVGGPGLWISVEDVYADIAAKKAKGHRAPKALGRKFAPPDALPAQPVAEGDRELKNVVVVLNPPKKLHKEIEVLQTLSDGTKLVVGPKSRAWVDALKRNPGPSSLRLVKGPILLSELSNFGDFHELDAAMRQKGTPMLVMPG